MNDWGPLVGLDKRGGWPSGNWRSNPTLRKVGKVTPEPPIKDIETWLDWQACNCLCHVGGWNLQPSQGGRPMETHLEIWTSSIPEVRSRVFPGQGYTAPPAPKCLIWSVFLPDELSYQDVQQQPFSLNGGLCPRVTVLVGRDSTARGPRFLPLGEKHPRAEREGEEDAIFIKWEVIQGLGRVNLGATSQWPQITPVGFGRVDSTTVTMCHHSSLD